MSDAMTFAGNTSQQGICNTRELSHITLSSWPGNIPSTSFPAPAGPRKHRLFAFSVTFIRKASLTRTFRITAVIGSISDEDPPPLPVSPPVYFSRLHSSLSWPPSTWLGRLQAAPALPPRSAVANRSQRPARHGGPVRRRTPRQEAVSAESRPSPGSRGWQEEDGRTSRLSPRQPLPPAGPGGTGPQRRHRPCVTGKGRPLRRGPAAPQSLARAASRQGLRRAEEGRREGGVPPRSPPAAILAGLRRFRCWEVNREGRREAAVRAGRTAGRWGRLRWRELMWPERRRQRGPSPG